MSCDLLAGAEWKVASTTAGAYAHPSALPPDLRWLTATVPGTVSAIGGEENPDELDWWFVTSVSISEVPSTLRFEGIATRATIWLDGVESAVAQSMFVPVELDVPAGTSVLSVAVRIDSLALVLKRRRPRGRWRSSMIAQQGLRHERTTMIGRAPVYGPVPVPVGLWRPVTLTPRLPARHVRLHASPDGTLRIRAELDRVPSVIDVRIGGRAFTISGDSAELDVSVVVDDVELWWPHTHGDPRLYPVTIAVDGIDIHSGVVGFRRFDLVRDGRVVRFLVNDVAMFARGGCWVPPDPVRLWVDAGRMRAELTRIRDAGLNMIRVVGTMVYEQREFWSLCAELGILVWQDVMTATTDPPEDEVFVGSVVREIEALLTAVGGNPALAVLSGGSETQQQPTMLGLDANAQSMPLLDDVIPDLLASFLPGTPYVTSSPSSTTGELHTHVGDGISHYFGVGGYLRPLSDVRTARVRFAAECLAFAVPPERRAVDGFFGSAQVAGHHPEWKAAVPRDRGSSWDFEDVRDHYVREIFDVDPHLVRRTDAELYLDYGRAAVCEAVTSSFQHWRRVQSECAGALVLTLRDLVPGAGWGFVDSAGTPKAPWYALARASSPIAVLLVDDGLDGVSIEIVDDTARPVDGILRVTLYGPAGPVGEIHERPVQVEPRSGLSVSLDSVVGSFADVNHAYRFGAQTYSAVVAELVDAAGAVLAHATHLFADTLGRQHDVGLSTVLESSGPGSWCVTVTTQWAARYVCVDVDGFEASDSWFHLAPGASRRIVLTGDRPAPSGHIRALNSEKRARIGL